MRWHQPSFNDEGQSSFVHGLMCHAMVPVHGQATPGSVSKFLVFGGYEYHERIISAAARLVVCTARPLRRSSDIGSGSEGSEGELEFQVQMFPVASSVPAEAGSGGMGPAARMNHSMCRLVHYSGEGHDAGGGAGPRPLEDVTNRFDSAVRVLVFGGVGECIGCRQTVIGSTGLHRSVLDCA